MASDERAQRWREKSKIGSRSARLLFEAGDYRGCANRAYYAVCQAATSACEEHGDVFAHGWENSTHEQLPDLICANGELTAGNRR